MVSTATSPPQALKVHVSSGRQSSRLGGQTKHTEQSKRHHCHQSLGREHEEHKQPLMSSDLIDKDQQRLTEGEAMGDSNVMPSMIVRQQKIQDGIASSSLNGLPAGVRQQQVVGQHQQHSNKQQMFDQDGLVVPKRVINPQVSSNFQPIIRDLNRELKFNQVRGKNVLDQKSELKKAMEKIEDSKRRKEAELDRLSRRTSLELRLEERAEKVAKEEESASQKGDNSFAHPCQNPLSNFSIRPIKR